MKKVWILLALLAMLTAVFSYTVFADTATGTDYPVTESYVRKALETLETKLTEKFTNTNGDGASVAYEVVTLKKGQSLLGACELILRAGTVSAVCPGVNGISDLTDGTDIPNATAVKANHLLLIPRDDGRGIRATSDDVYVMVRGAYVIQ